jgi:hypothetical protein
MTEKMKSQIVISSVAVLRRSDEGLKAGDWKQK